MKKAIITLAVCLVVLLSATSVFAAGSITVSNDGTDVTVVGAGFTAGEEIGILSLKPEKTFDDLEDCNDEDENEENDSITVIDYIDQVEAIGGNFELKFTSSGNSGRYMVYATGASSQEYSIQLDEPQNGVISGKVTAQGDLTKISITSKKEGTETSTTVNADENGVFSIPNLEGGTYSVELSKTGHLTMTINDVAVLATINTTISDKVLIAGDINNDGSINGADLSILLVAYNSVKNQTKYNESTDFNNDDAINGSDLSFLLINYNKTTSVYSEDE